MPPPPSQPARALLKLIFDQTLPPPPPVIPEKADEEILKKLIHVFVDSIIPQSVSCAHVPRVQIVAEWEVHKYMNYVANDNSVSEGISKAYLSLLNKIAQTQDTKMYDRKGKRPTAFAEQFLGNVVGFKQQYSKTGNAKTLWDRVSKLTPEHSPEIQLRAGVYTYEENGMYVCFANKHIGGGIVGAHGFVQEEIAVFESNQFPLQVYWKREKDPLRSKIQLADLDTIPAILKVKHLFDVKQPGEQYRTQTGAHAGRIDWNKYRSDLEKNVANNPNYFIQAIVPREIFWLNMAAINIKHTNKTGMTPSSVLSTMLLVAYRAFREAIDVLCGHGLPLVIHTGNWGAGAFGHDVRVAFGIQQAAAWLAGKDAGVRIKLMYYTYDTQIHNILSSISQKPLDMPTLFKITQNSLDSYSQKKKLIWSHNEVDVFLNDVRLALIQLWEEKNLSITFDDFDTLARSVVKYLTGDFVPHPDLRDHEQNSVLWSTAMFIEIYLAGWGLSGGFFVGETRFANNDVKNLRDKRQKAMQLFERTRQYLQRKT